jgi:site-specific recombinase XerD
MSGAVTVRVPVPAFELDATNPHAPAHHGLGPVADDWAAAEVVLQAVRANSNKEGSQTEATYRFHLAKLRWYCENVLRVTPSRWSYQDVTHFREFLAKLPQDAICIPDGKVGEPGYTPFRKQPSVSSQADILRFVHALFNAWHKTGYIQISPMALTKARTVRRTSTNRAVPLDLYATVLQVMQDEVKETYADRQYHARDQFIFAALRGLGLRATELATAKMSAFTTTPDPENGQTYRTFCVEAHTAKSGVERFVPVSNNVWSAFVTYRSAFNLPPDLTPSDGSTPLILSPRTRPVMINKSALKRTADRRFFNAWGAVKTRFGLYKIVTGRLENAAVTLEQSDPEKARLLRDASPHWLRHTFGKAAVLSNHDIRSVASALGHSDLSTVMGYTRQEALDIHREWEKKSPGIVAKEGLAGGAQPSDDDNRR